MPYGKDGKWFPLVKPRTPVLVLAGARSKDAAEVFSSRTFKNIHTIQFDQVPSIPKNFAARTIIVSAHSATVEGLTDAWRNSPNAPWSDGENGSAIELLVNRLTHGEEVHRVFKVREDKLRRPESYIGPKEVANRVVAIAAELRERHPNEVGTKQRPFRVFVASCYSGAQEEEGRVYDSIGNAMTEAGFEFEVHASRGQLTKGGAGDWDRDGFFSKRLDGMELLSSIHTRNYPPAKTWSSLESEGLGRRGAAAEEGSNRPTSLPPINRFSRRR